MSAAKYAKKAQLLPVTDGALETVEHEINGIMEKKGSENTADIRSDLQSIMTEKCGIFRNKTGLAEALNFIKILNERFNNISIKDKGKIFNTGLMEALELRNLLDVSEIIVAGALAREESRGSHFRTDFPDRDDDCWMKHTLAYRDKPEPLLEYKPVTITRYTPKERAY